MGLRLISIGNGKMSATRIKIISPKERLKILIMTNDLNLKKFLMVILKICLNIINYFLYNLIESNLMPKYKFLNIRYL